MEKELDAIKFFLFVYNKQMALGSFIEYYRDNTRNELSRTIMELYENAVKETESIEPTPSEFNSAQETTTLNEQFASANESASTTATSSNTTNSILPNEGIVDFILSLFIKVFQAVNQLEPQVAMGVVVAIGFIALLLGMTTENMISSHTIILTICIGGFIYWYLKSQYSTELQKLRKKNRMLKTDSALDELCVDGDVAPENKQVCDNYLQAKTNFYEINNSLIQKYNWKRS
jgi:hypothetical protein